MSNDVFSRYETKYLLDDETYIQIRSKLHSHMVLDQYNVSGKAYTISNIYYDTPDDYFIRTSLQKPKYKEKLRLRAYGVPTLQSQVFLEVKKKVCGLVNKRRSALRLEEAYEFLNSKLCPMPYGDMNPQILKELTYIIQRYPLEPKLYLAYDRIAYFDNQDGSLRVSFDTNIRTRREDLRLELGDQGKLLLKPGIWLMEIKTPGAVPIWLCSLLSKYQIRAASFSKYGTEYQRHLVKQMRKEAIPCSISYLPAAPTPRSPLEAPC